LKNATLSCRRRNTPIPKTVTSTPELTSSGCRRRPAGHTFRPIPNKQAEIGKIIDEARVAIEKDNLQLKGVLSKDYTRPALDK
jgi:hypothetical protein